MADDQLARFRAAVDDDHAGPELEEAVAAMRSAKLDPAGDAQDRARGYARDHPRIELLRRKGLAGVRDFEPAAWLHTAGAARRITDTPAGGGAPERLAEPPRRPDHRAAF